MTESQTPNVQSPNENVENNVIENQSTGNVDTTNPTNTTPNHGNLNPAFYTSMVEEATKSANLHNGLADQIQKVGDRVALMDSLKEKPEQTGDDEFVAIVKNYYELSDALEAVEKSLFEKAQPFINDALQKSGVEEKQAKADEFAKQVKATVQFLQAMGADVSAIPTLAGRTNRSGSTTSGDGRGAGTPKYRNLDVYVDGKIAQEKVSVKQSDGSVKNEMRSNLTYGAKAANVTLPVFREKFTEAQGTTDASRFKDRVEFEIVDGKGNKHSVVVVKAKVD